MCCLLEPFKDWPVEFFMKSQVAGYKKSVVPVFHKLVCVFLLNCDHIYKPQKKHLIILLMIEKITLI